MRKIRPGDVIDDFKDQLEDLEKFYDRVSGRLHGTKHEKADQSRLAELTFMSMAVATEGFLSDLSVSFINRDSSAFRSDIEARMNQSISSKFGPWVAEQVDTGLGKHLKAEEVWSALAPEGRNLPVTDPAKLRKNADKFFAGRYLQAVKNLTKADERLLEAVRRTRNYVAHRSAASKQEMNEALKALGKDSGNKSLKRGDYKIHKVGAYLKAKKGGKPRLKRYGERLRQIAEKLRP